MNLLTQDDLGHMIESLRSTITALEGAVSMGLVEQSEGVFIQKCNAPLHWARLAPTTEERVEAFRGRLARLEATRNYLSRIEFAAQEEIESAREAYQGDDIQIDDDARVSRCDGGNESCWVEAWVKIGGSE